MEQMANIKHLLDKIRTAIYGKEVRGSLADGIEAINDEVEDNTEIAVNVEHRQDAVEEQFDDVLSEWSDDREVDNAETIAARTNRVTGENHKTLGNRLDDENEKVTQQLAETTELDGFTTNDYLEMPSEYNKIPSFLGNSLTTHPSVIDFGREHNKSTWNGFRYWMAHTPYPGTHNENPSIAASNSRRGPWALPDNAPNPIIDTPSNGYYSDPELVYLPDVDKLRIYYRQVDDVGEILWSIESDDGSNWSDPQRLLEYPSKPILSPSIIRESSGEWKMWTVQDRNTFGYYESNDGLTWEKIDDLQQPWKNWSGWHFGVTKDGNGKYHMLASTYATDMGGEGTQYRPIIYAHSVNGRIWTGIERPQLIPVGWAGGYLYRPSFIIINDEGIKDGLPYVTMWFGAKGDAIADEWHIGYSEGFIRGGGVNSSLTGETTKRKNIGEFFKVLASNLITPFAYISRLITKRLVIKSDYSQPLVELFDGRIGRDGGNNLRIEYQGDENPDGIRFNLIFTDDEGNYSTYRIAPYRDSLMFNQDGTLERVGTINSPSAANGFKITDVREGNRFNLIRYDPSNDKFIFGAKIHEVEFEHAFRVGEVRFVEDSSGNLQVQVGDYKWVFRIDGKIDGNSRDIINLRSIIFGRTQSDSSAANGSLYEDGQGKLKYKNLAGDITELT